MLAPTSVLSPTATSSSTSAPSTLIRPRPIDAKPTVTSPFSVGVHRHDNSSTAAVKVGALPAKNTNEVANRSSRINSTPASSRKRTNTPGPPVDGLVSSANGSAVIPIVATAPSR